jgi:hypothetical protein
MGNSSKRRWKSLTLKIQHLQLELEEREERLKLYEVDFLKELSSDVVEDIEIKTPPLEQNGPTIIMRGENSNLPSEEEIEVPPSSEGPEDVKKLWRQIAMATHPDKTMGDEYKSDLYKRANEAWKTSKYGELYRIALELGIEPAESDEAGCAFLEELSKEIQGKISEKEKSILWEWGNAASDKKNVIFDVYLKSKGKRKKKHM